jgi:hypothetical protein
MRLGGLLQDCEDEIRGRHRRVLRHEATFIISEHTIFERGL